MCVCFWCHHDQWMKTLVVNVKKVETIDTYFDMLKTYQKKAEKSWAIMQKQVLSRFLCNLLHLLQRGQNAIKSVSTYSLATDNKTYHNFSKDYTFNVSLTCWQHIFYISNQKVNSVFLAYPLPQHQYIFCVEGLQFCKLWDLCLYLMYDILLG